MTITQRQLGLAVLAVQLLGTLLVTIASLSIQPNLTLAAISGIATLVYAGLLFAYWRGWEYARHSAVIVLTLLAALGMPEPYVTQQFATAIFIPPILALILAGPAWVLGSAATILVVLLARSNWQGTYSDPQALMIFAMIIGGIILARVATDSAQRAAEKNGARAEEALLRMEQQSRDLADANERMRVQIDQQRELLDLVTTLETPVVPLAEKVLFAPIVGHIDSRRAEALTARLLAEAHDQSARLVVLDIAGVAMMDTAVARALLNMAQALRLLGCEVTISGISASVALSLINLGVNLDEVRTAHSPHEALAQHLNTIPLHADGNGRGLWDAQRARLLATNGQARS